MKRAKNRRAWMAVTVPPRRRVPAIAECEALSSTTKVQQVNAVLLGNDLLVAYLPNGLKGLPAFISFSRQADLHKNHRGQTVATIKAASIPPTWRSQHMVADADEQPAGSTVQ